MQVKCCLYWIYSLNHCKKKQINVYENIQFYKQQNI